VKRRLGQQAPPQGSPSPPLPRPSLMLIEFAQSIRYEVLLESVEPAAGRAAQHAHDRVGGRLRFAEAARARSGAQLEGGWAAASRATSSSTALGLGQCGRLMRERQQCRARTLCVGGASETSWFGEVSMELLRVRAAVSAACAHRA
jgi:hypothetical protein